MTKLHAVRAHVRRSPSRVRSDTEPHIELWNWLVGPKLVRALEEVFANWKPETA